MKNNIYYTEGAQRDLDAIWDAVAHDQQDPAAAKQLVGRLTDRAARLADYAQLGTPLASIAHIISDYRFFATDGYLTFYHVQGSDVFIDRVLCGRQNYLQLLSGIGGEAIPSESEMP